MATRSIPPVSWSAYRWRDYLRPTPSSSARDHHRLSIAVQWHFDQGAESADSAKHLAAHGGVSPQVLSLETNLLAGIDVDTASRYVTGARSIIRSSHKGDSGRSAGSAAVYLLRGHCRLLDYLNVIHPPSPRRFYVRYLRPCTRFYAERRAACLADSAFGLTRIGSLSSHGAGLGRSEAAQRQPSRRRLKIVLIPRHAAPHRDEDGRICAACHNARRYVQQIDSAPDDQLWVAFDGLASHAGLL